VHFTELRFYHEKATVENDLGSLDGSTSSSTASTSYQAITFHDNPIVICAFTSGINIFGLGMLDIRERR
jgi:hypothetical protein